MATVGCTVDQKNRWNFEDVVRGRLETTISTFDLANLGGGNAPSRSSLNLEGEPIQMQGVDVPQIKADPEHLAQAPCKRLCMHSSTGKGEAGQP